jgi:ATP-dependent RNA helicase RhlE
MVQFAQFNLKSPLLSALSYLGIEKPTLIQERSFAPIMSGVDVCGIAQTGTGKTLAYLLPCLQQWKFSKEKNPQIIIIVPTRELVLQVLASIQNLCIYISVTAVAVYGGVNINTQKLALSEGADIVVGTPGRLYDLIVDAAIKVKTVKRIVIDEMDEMLNLGFRTQIKNILDLLPTKRQNLLFSATITTDVADIMQQYFNNPQMVEAAPTGTPLKNIMQSGYVVPNYNTKKNLLHYILSTDTEITKAVVFASTKKIANDLFEFLEKDFEAVIGIIHSDKSQNFRFDMVNKFADGTCKILIATDIVARGIDISAVSHVINFDIPDEPENYMHRIGRTGRADKSGIAVTLLTERENDLLVNIETLMNQKLPINNNPEELVYSTILIDDELPKIKMKQALVKLPSIENKGAAFHEKSAKNQKVNFIVSRKDRMMKKYGKPKTRGQKKK